MQNFCPKYLIITFERLTLFSPDTIIENKQTNISIIESVMLFKHLIGNGELVVDEYNYLCREMKDTHFKELYGNKNIYGSVAEFWSRIGKITNSLDEFKFENIYKFVQKIMIKLK